eukprot:comp59632_c0_seq1/m.47856 comp59632_c0_seq1/g.47856  ORF comp59632_c0_seq1/g.47856 comp59632_c0_seq1/m.47856 type:complete len:641 (-) comp59632_c0_seq1:9-1931(-)
MGSNTPKMQPHLQNNLPAFRRTPELERPAAKQPLKESSVGLVETNTTLGDLKPIQSALDAVMSELAENEPFLSPPVALDARQSPTGHRITPKDPASPAPKHTAKDFPVAAPAHRRSRSSTDLTLSHRSGNVPPNVMEGNLISNKNGEKLYTRAWLPEGGTKGLLFICHGFGEHSGRYDTVAPYFNQIGVVVFAHDHQGHGRSDGDRGEIKDYSIYTEDMMQHVEMMMNTYRGLPCFLWGHAMGACIAVTVIRKHHDMFRGLLLTAPMIMPDPLAATPFKMLLAKNIGLVNPKFSIGKIDPECLSSDPQKVKDWVDDPLNYHGTIRINWANIILRAVQDNFKKLQQVTTPFIVMQGTWDEVVVPEGSMHLYKEARTTDKTLRMLEGLMHDLHNEADSKREAVIKELVEWVRTRLVPTEEGTKAPPPTPATSTPLTPTTHHNDHSAQPPQPPSKDNGNTVDTPVICVDPGSSTDMPHVTQVPVNEKTEEELCSQDGAGLSPKMDGVTLPNWEIATSPNLESASSGPDMDGAIQHALPNMEGATSPNMESAPPPNMEGATAPNMEDGPMPNMEGATSPNTARAANGASSTQISSSGRKFSGLTALDRGEALALESAVAGSSRSRRASEELQVEHGIMQRVESV